MSGLDRVLIHDLERAQEEDLVDLQQFLHRAIQDTLKELLEASTWASSGFSLGAPRDIVAGGLEAVSAGSDVSVSPGVLLQQSPTLTPLPGAKDSTYRWSRLGAAQTLTPASPGSTTFYLLEAQMTEVVTLNEPRDFYDTALGIFTPAAVDKHIERRPTFQLRAGGASAPAPQADWVPIAVLRRPAGGGPVAPSDLIDVRPLVHQRHRRGGVQHYAELTDLVLRTTHLPGAAASELIRLEAAGAVGGRPVSFRSLTSFDVTHASIVSPATTLSANNWYYLWLCSWEGLLPSSAYAHAALSILQEGLLVLSSVAPVTQGALTNGAVISRPAPWGSSSVAIGNALCVAALRRNAGNDGWVWSIGRGKGETRIRALQAYTNGSPTMMSVGPNAVNLATFVPENAKWARIRVLVGGDTGTPGDPNGTVGVGPTGSAAGVDYDTALTDFANGDAVEFEVPLVDSLSFDLKLIGTNGPNSVEVWVLGWGQ